jgi:hypothetical protein
MRKIAASLIRRTIKNEESFAHLWVNKCAYATRHPAHGTIRNFNGPTRQQ